jgi:hypothetical protein
MQVFEAGKEKKRALHQITMEERKEAKKNDGSQRTKNASQKKKEVT